MWAADCAERVLGLFEVEAPGDGRPRDAIARLRAFARGEVSSAEAIRVRFVNGGAAREVSVPAAVSAARAAGQAAAIPHMGAHALGAAAYAARPLVWPARAGQRLSTRKSAGSFATCRRLLERLCGRCHPSVRMRLALSGRGCSRRAFLAR